MAKKRVEERGIPASWRKSASPSSPEDGEIVGLPAHRKPRSHALAIGPTQRMPDWSAEEDRLGRPLTEQEKVQRELAAKAALLSAPALPALHVSYKDPSVRRRSLEGDGEQTFWRGPHAK